MTQTKMTILKETFATVLSPVCLTIWVVATVVAVVAGPFGTYSALSSGERLAYWGLISLTSVPLGYGCVAIVNMFWTQGKPLTRDILRSGFAIVVITADVWLISNMSVWGGQHVPSFGLFLSFVTLIAFAATMTKYLTLAALSGLSAQEEPKPDETPDPPRLLQRLPQAEGSSVLHLSVQDHLVEVNTCAGSHSVRMRFRDALGELDGVEGYRVHRSHWVAHAAISGVERENARVFLQLTNGNRIPVSRNYRPELEEAGIL
ncbi:LytTR family DNA-binding domain-containing protein [Shimia sediminis]|uniref:LytTR family DNA-binding domain-containing protein n=1 Tax=Shimia sediminis TaxID=2497945 RepID=UPI000F8F0BEB|nr:LytTR family DNA-binding domain-containing protein [Shimia sediminis]